MQGIGLLPDVLTDMSLRRRRDREIADLHYLIGQKAVMTASVASLKRDGVFGSVGMNDLENFLKKHNMQPWKEGEPFEFVICARVNLDHPIYFPDNVIIACADCGCDLQQRPDVPKGIAVCICCAARRIRAERAKMSL